MQTFGKKKTATAVAHCRAGRGLLKVNGSPIHLLQPEILRFKVYEPILVAGPDKFAAATAVSSEEWRNEMPLHGEMVEGKLAEKAPKEVTQRFEELKAAFR